MPKLKKSAQPPFVSCTACNLKKKVIWVFEAGIQSMSLSQVHSSRSKCRWWNYKGAVLVPSKGWFTECTTISLLAGDTDIINSDAVLCKNNSQEHDGSLLSWSTATLSIAEPECQCVCCQRSHQNSASSKSLSQGWRFHPQLLSTCHWERHQIAPSG